MLINPKNRFEKIRYYAVIRWAIYIFLIFVSSVLINVGQSVKPIYFIPLCLCICMNEGEYTSAVLGGICGLIIDEASGHTFFGFSSIIMIAFCVGSVLIFRHLLFKNIFNIVILTGVCTFIYQLLIYFFYYAMWDYEGAGYVFSDKTDIKKILSEKSKNYRRSNEGIKSKSVEITLFILYISNPKIFLYIHNPKKGDTL